LPGTLARISIRPCVLAADLFTTCSASSAASVPPTLDVRAVLNPPFDLEVRASEMHAYEGHFLTSVSRAERYEFHAVALLDSHAVCRRTRMGRTPILDCRGGRTRGTGHPLVSACVSG